MRRCIFCLRTESNFDKKTCWSEEHIIPLSLGNTQLKTFDVCSVCNNSLGRYVDSFFVNNPLIRIIRNALRLKSESGKIPPPIREGINQFGQKVKMDESQNVSVVPSFSAKPTSNGLHIKGTFSSKDEAKKAIAKTLNRKGYSPTEIDYYLRQVDGIESNSYQPFITSDFEYERNRISLFILKIAYEYSYYKLGEIYLNDKTALEIRQFLYDAICGKMENKCDPCRWIIDEPNQVADDDTVVIASMLRKHSISLVIDTENRIICNVFLFDRQWTALVSNDASKYEFLTYTDVVEIKT